MHASYRLEKEWEMEKCWLRIYNMGERERAHFFLSRLSARPLFRGLVFLAARSYETRCERERETTKYEMQRGDTLEIGARCQS